MQWKNRNNGAAGYPAGRQVIRHFCGLKQVSAFKLWSTRILVLSSVASLWLR
jgi:hypothetical protein